MPVPAADVLDTALAFHDAGCSVVRVATDGTKRPLGQWKTYITERATRDDITSWFTDGHPGVGIVCGHISQNLEMLELEGRAITDGVLGQLNEAALANGLAELWRRVTTGYAEATPSGGVHFLYRVSAPIPGNTKLARRPATNAELAEIPGDKIKVLVETRGEGGFVVVAPSHGPVHATGKAWQRAIGNPSTIPTLAADEHQALHQLTRLVDKMPLADPVEVPDTKFHNSKLETGGVSPGDDYNERASWDDILTPHGWKLVSRRALECTWRRPGKTDPGISATTGYGDRGDWLYVFTTSTEFDAERTYTKFAAYAILEHAGDYSAAAKALSAAGYGTRATVTIDSAKITGELEQLAGHGENGAEPQGLLYRESNRTQTAPPTIITPDATTTDVGNADLLVRTYGDRIRYCPERGQWLRWGGSHWAWDDARYVVEYAKSTILAIDTSDGVIAKHRHRSLSKRAIDAMIYLASSQQGIVASASLLDSDPYALCTPSGVVNLITGHTSAPEPADLHTRCTTVHHDPDAPTPRWTKFLEDTFGGDTSLTGFVQRLAGYSATGIVTHHVMPFLHGSGQNGKSVFLDVIRRVLGDYAATTPTAFLMAGIQQHETEIARLAGMRFIVCSEVNQEARFDEAKVKLLTGGDALTARFMNKDHFTFTPSHHLWLMGNHQPRVSSGGDSFWRRLRLIPFSNTVPDEAKIDGLDAQLADEEGPGILAWIVAGAVQALATGLAEPSLVMAATRTYAAEEDALGRFVADRCRLGGAPLVRIDTTALRSAYDDWCRGEAEKPLSPQVLGRELRSRYGIEQVRSHGRRFYLGLQLFTEDEDIPDGPEPTEHWTDR